MVLQQSPVPLARVEWEGLQTKRNDCAVSRFDMGKRVYSKILREWYLEEEAVPPSYPKRIPKRVSL